MKPRFLVLQICSGPTCGADRAVLTARAEKHLEKHGLSDRVIVTTGGCFARCSVGPNIFVQLWQGPAPSAADLALSVARALDDPEASWVQEARPNEIGPMIDWFVERWKLLDH